MTAQEYIESNGAKHAGCSLWEIIGFYAEYFHAANSKLTTTTLSKQFKDLIELHPYKVVGKPETYCDYNQGWEDGLSIMLERIEKSQPAKTVNEEYKKVTGHSNPYEHQIYDKAREEEQSVIMSFIEKWDGETNSALGDLLSKKVANKAVAFGEWCKLNAINEDFIAEHHHSVSELYAIFDKDYTPSDIDWDKFKQPFK